jgi:hypothetical protein
MTMMMWFLLFRLFLSTLFSGPSDLRGIRGAGSEGNCSPSPLRFLLAKKKTLALQGL